MNLNNVISGFMIGLCLLSGCRAEKKGEALALGSNADQVVADRERTRLRKELLTALPKKVTYPKDNAYSKEKEALGKLLYFDPILSGGKDVSCATCHHPSMGFAERRDLPIGVNGKGMGKKRVFNEPNDIPMSPSYSPCPYVINGRNHDECGFIVISSCLCTGHGLASPGRSDQPSGSPRLNLS